MSRRWHARLLNEHFMKLPRIQAGSFYLDVLKLMSGTIAGRAVALAVMPVVTRLYSPGDFSVLAVYMSTLSIFAVVACLRFEIAIPLVQDDADAANLLLLSLSVASVVALVLLLAGLAAPETIAGFLRTPEFAQYLWLVAIGVFLAASYAALQNWATRAKRFGAVARTRIMQSLSGATISLLFGWAGIAPLGLILGNMLNVGAGGFGLVVSALRKDKGALSEVSLSSLAKTSKKFASYPIFSVPEAVANNIGTQLPILIVAAYGDHEAGYLLLALQVMAVPMALMGSTVSQVYISRANDEMRKGQLNVFTQQVMSRMAATGALPIIFLGLFSPVLFDFAFGEQWRRSGEIASLFAPWFLTQFIVSPVSTVMYATGNQKSMLFLTAFGAVLRVSSVWLAAAYDVSYCVPAMAVASTVYYFLVGAWSARAANFKARDYQNLARIFLNWRIVGPSLILISISLAY